MVLPFDIPHLPGGEFIELEPDTQPALPGHDVLVSYYVGGPWIPPVGVEGADAVTVTPRLRYEGLRPVVFMYQVTYWRSVDDGR